VSAGLTIVDFEKDSDQSRTCNRAANIHMYNVALGGHANKLQSILLDESLWSL